MVTSKDNKRYLVDYHLNVRKFYRREVRHGNLYKERDGKERGNRPIVVEFVKRIM